MQLADSLTLLNILIAFLGVAFVVLGFLEWRTLRQLRRTFQTLEARLREENHRSMKAAHRVISSYAITDVDARIALLESAVSLYPAAFNGYNALGYAFLEKGEQAKAIDAFCRATVVHPHDKEGYCDLGYAYLQGGEEDLAVHAFRKAIAVEASAAADLRQDARLTALLPRILA